VTVVSRSCEFRGNSACRSAQDSGVERVFANSWRAGVTPTRGLRLEPSRGDAAGSAGRVQISSTTVCPESKAATIVSNDQANAVSKASFLQLPSRTQRNRPASPGWLAR